MRGPSQRVVKAPCWALPPVKDQWCGSPFNVDVTNRSVTDGRFAQSFDVLPGFTQPTRLFSWSVMIHGPLPVPRYHAVALPKYVVSIVPLPSSRLSVSALP